MMSVPTDMYPHLRAALPHLTFRAQVIVDALMLGGGDIGSATYVSRMLGMGSRFALGRMLWRQGLPGLRELSGWISVLAWVIAAERSDLSLFMIAVHSKRSPAVCYRLVRRLTGRTWVKVRARGSAWVLGLFVERCKRILQQKRKRGRPGSVPVERGGIEASLHRRVETKVELAAYPAASVLVDVKQGTPPQIPRPSPLARRTTSQTRS